MKRTTVLLVEDHPVFRMGLRQLLETQEDLCVTGEAESIEQAVEQLRSCQPDLVLLDLGLKDGSGLDVLPHILEETPRTRVIILTGQGPEKALPALRRAARGFVSKDAVSSHLLEAIHAVLQGAIWAEAQTTGQLVDELFARERRRRAEESLTPREREVLRLIGAGKRNAEIGRELFISLPTVRTHVSSVMSKLEISDRLQLMLYASRDDEEDGG